MKTKGRVASAAVAMLAVLSVNFSQISVAAAESASTVASASVSSSTLQDFENVESFTEEDLQSALFDLFTAQKAQGLVGYKTLDDGSYEFTTMIHPDGQDSVEFSYLLPDSDKARELATGAIHSPYSSCDGGNEWYPKIWAGQDGQGTWIRFNRKAQSLMYTAAGTALKAAICAIPGVNAIGCAVVWGATLVAKNVMKRIGRCPTDRPWLYVYPAKTHGECRS